MAEKQDCEFKSHTELGLEKAEWEAYWSHVR